MNSYPTNISIQLTAAFTDDITGVLTDPVKVTLRVMDPTGASVLYGPTSVNHPSVGNFNFRIIPTIPGTWRWRWEGTGSVFAANEGRCEVRPSAFFVITPTATFVAAGHARCVGVSM
jgi:hypothetical protein